jgi:hypothetical protein
VRSGKALDAARNDYTDIDRKPEVEAALPTAWDELTEKEDPSLIEVIANKTEILCGFKPTPEVIIRFLKNDLQRVKRELVPIRGSQLKASVREGEPEGTKAPKPPDNPKIREFFRQLLELSEQKTGLFRNITPPGYQNWVTAGSGRSGMGFLYVIGRNEGRAEFYLIGSTPRHGKALFYALKGESKEIEASFGELLDWDFKEGRKQHHIRSWTRTGGLQDEDRWPEIQKDLVHRMVRLEKALRDHIKALGKAA